MTHGRHGPRYTPYIITVCTKIVHWTGPTFRVIKTHSSRVNSYKSRTKKEKLLLSKSLVLLIPTLPNQRRTEFNDYSFAASFSLFTQIANRKNEGQTLHDPPTGSCGSTLDGKYHRCVRSGVIGRRVRLGLLKTLVSVTQLVRVVETLLFSLVPWSHARTPHQTTPVTLNHDETQPQSSISVTNSPLLPASHPSWGETPRRI